MSLRRCTRRSFIIRCYRRNGRRPLWFVLRRFHQGYADPKSGLFVARHGHTIANDALGYYGFVMDSGDTNTPFTYLAIYRASSRTLTPTNCRGRYS